jgi:gliding motility-associated-like protein/uncharacterized repeat protein (TIGR01451 family)
MTVTTNNTAILSSAVGTNAQTTCINTAITNITYTTTGATGATVTNLPTGVWAGNVVTISGTPTVAGAALTYTVTLTGGCGNITTTGTIAVKAVTVTNSQSNILCFGASTGAINITAAGGTGPYTYAWTGAGVVAGAEDQSGLAAGSYSVIVTDANGCLSLSYPFTITQPAAAVTVTSTQTNILCFGASTGAINITAVGGTGPYTYAWTGAGVVAGSEDQTGLAAGAYSVIVTDVNSCVSVSYSFTITQLAAVTAPIVGTITQPTCILTTGSVTLSGLPATGTWTVTESVGSTTITGTGTTGTFSGLSANTYSFKVTNNAGCTSVLSANVVIKTATILVGCISPGTVVTINAQPAIPATPTASLTQPVCGVTTGTITVTAPVAAGNTYSIDGINYTNTTGIFTLVPIGTYTVTARNSLGCTSVPSTMIIKSICVIADLSISNTVDNTYPLIGKAVVFTIIATNNGPNGSTGAIVTDILPGGYTYVSSTTTTGTFNPATGVWTIGTINTGSTVTLTITVTVNTTGTYISTATITGIETDGNTDNNTSTTVTYPTDFFIPEGFSPNGDGINEYFVIRGIGNYPNNTIAIFNRWGNKVFEASHYLNTWDGRSTRGLKVGGDELPTGTYFYLLDLGDGSAIIKGTIYLNR